MGSSPKNIAGLLLAFALGCSPAKTGGQPNSAVLNSDCPKQARCTIELIPNKTMIVATDANGLHYTLADQSDTNVIVYKYDKIVKGNLQDAGYREEIVFEYDGKRNIHLTDTQLQTTKMLFGRFCYCKGQTGYFPVRQGQLTVDTHGNAQFDFKVAEVPQVIRQIQFSFN
jgi:hypothetical protein